MPRRGLEQLLAERAVGAAAARAIGAVVQEMEKACSIMWVTPPIWMEPRRGVPEPLAAT